MIRCSEPTNDFLVALENMPERGEGRLHNYTMGLCNKGIKAGYTADQLYDILEPLRPWRPNELESTIQKAEEEASDWKGDESCGAHISNTMKRAQRCNPEAAAVGKILTEDPERAVKICASLIQAGGGEIDPFGPEVHAASNPMPDIIPPVEHLAESEFAGGMLSFLRVAYRPDDLLYVGSKYEKGDAQRDHIKPAGEWIDFFSNELASVKNKPRPGTKVRMLMNLGYKYSAFCINPLTGEPDEKGSYRSMKCIKEFRYVLLESDDLDLKLQIPLLAGLKMPVVAMTFSGNESIHALTKVDAIPGVGPIHDLAEWKTKMKGLFAQLTPLGFDGATKDPGRPSRFPGIWRPDSRRFQRLLFLNPNGGFHV